MSGLYGSDYQPFSNPALPQLDGPGGVFQTSPLCGIIYDSDDPGLLQRPGPDLIYALPPGAGPHRIASADLAEILACLERSGIVALVGMCKAAITKTAGGIIAMADRGRLQVYCRAGGSA